MLDSLQIKNFRCFEDLEIESLGRVNLIVGKNNVGKSTLLEAMSVFSLAQAANDTNMAKSALISIMELFSKNRNEFANNNNGLGLANKITTLHHKTSKNDIVIGNKNKSIFSEIGFKSFENSDKTSVILGLTFLTNRRHFDFNITTDYDITPRDKPKNLLMNSPVMLTHSFLGTTLKDDEDMSEVWDSIRIQRGTSLAVEALKIIDPRIEEVFYTTNKVTMVSTQGQPSALPIKKMGEGMSRLLQMFLYAFQSRKGYLMIDEFENGLHYSIQEEVWKKLLKLAEELDIQVFATTHSMDTIRSFCKVAVADKETEGKLISLGRDAGKTNNGKIISHVYDEEELNWIVNSGMEIR